MGTVNYSQLMESAEEPESFTPLPQGTYDMIVDSVEVKQTKTGKTMFVLVLKVASGEHQNRKVWNNMVVSPESPKAMGFFFRDMAALGADQAFFSGNPDDSDVAAKIMGASVTAKVGFQKDDPTRNDVKGLIPAGGSAAASSVTASSAPPKLPF